jgi:NAD(P)-dependent dehydrogenase (short-subunit alcohol dehydrogenase family)
LTQTGKESVARFVGKVAIITGSALAEGGGLGIGGATARLLAGEGAHVVCADLDGQGADRLAGLIIKEGGSARALEVDVSDEKQVSSMVDDTIEAWGRVDILHNNAATLSLDTLFNDIDIIEMDLELWNRTFAVNLTSAMFGCKYSIPHMLEQGGGAIVNTSSVNGILGDNTRPAYSASKAALNMLTQTVATTYGKHSIRCNAVCPGLTLSNTAMANLSPELLQVFERHNLTPTAASPLEVARAVAFLASEDASFITGQIICVDGGLTAHLPFVADFARMGVGSVHSTRAHVTKRPTS